MAQVRPDPPVKRQVPVVPVPLPEKPVLPREIALEIDNFEAEVARFLSGELSPERFRAFRLAHGVYGQRQPGVQMVRVKIPTGALTGAQMTRLADIGEAFSPTGMLHLTTRQDIQLHYIDLVRVPHMLRLMAEAGLTSREACGNSVRNVTSCPVSGFIADELFDVQPYALATYAYLVRNPFCQQLARKFKIAFSACPEDCASTAIHDIGLVGRIESRGGAPRYGFKVLVGGGLGSTPFTARVLSEFVPVEELLPTIKGIIQVFSAHGNRRNKMKARLKFVVHRHGIEAIRAEVAEAVAALTPQELEEADLFAYVPDAYLTLVARHLGIAGPRAEAGDENGVHSADDRGNGNGNGHGHGNGYSNGHGHDNGRSSGHDNAQGNGHAMDAAPDPVFLRWQSTNVRRHHDPARAVVTVSFPLGDLEAARFRALASLVTAHAGDEARISIQQDLILPNVPRARLRALYDGLAASGLAEASAGTALNVTSCPGADTCGLGITSSKGLARAIRSELLPMAENGGLDLLRGVTIKMSGCPNSCGQHHVANIGLHGVAKKVNGHMIPAYQLHLGGKIGPGDARIGDPLDKIPAKHVPKAVAAILRLYQTVRLEEEPFADFVQRWPRQGIDAVLAPFVSGSAGEADAAIDWGQHSAFTTEEIGTGECAGAGIDAVVDPFDNYVAEIRQGALFMEREQWADALANLSRSRYTLARVLLEALGKNPESDYETACEVRAQIIDRGFASEMWNELGGEIEALLRTRRPDPAAIRSLYERSAGLLEESKKVHPFLALKKASGGGGEIPA